MPEKESVSLRYHVCQFLSKTDNLGFFGPNLSKNGFRVANSETNVVIRISIFQIPCVPIFRQSGQL